MAETRIARPLDEAAARAATRAAFAAVKADDVSVQLLASESAFVRYANNEVTTSGVVSDCVTRVTCAVGGRHATVSLHSVTPSEVAEATRRAHALALLAPVDPEWLPTAGPSTLAPVAAAWSDATAHLGPDERAQWVATALAEIKKRKLVGAGFLEQNRATVALATRGGFFGLHDATNLNLTTTARTPDGSGSGWALTSGVRPDDVDVLGATRHACDKAERSHKPAALDPGTYAVVLESAAVASLVEFLSSSLEARDADEGHSPFVKPGGLRIGERLCGSLTLRCNPRAPLSPSAPFDDEGLPRTPVTFVDNGVLKKLRVSRFWGKQTGKSADARYDTVLTSGPKATPLVELIAGLDRGLLVTRFWYIRATDPQSLSVTGLTRDGVFLVEKGKIIRPVNNFRFNQSILAMFADCEAYGPPEREDGGAGVAPAVLCRRFHMASRSDAV